LVVDLVLNNDSGSWKVTQSKPKRARFMTRRRKIAGGGR
jgi:hypothetical protein